MLEIFSPRKSTPRRRGQKQYCYIVEADAAQLLRMARLAALNAAAAARLAARMACAWRRWNKLLRRDNAQFVQLLSFVLAQLNRRPKPYKLERRVQTNTQTPRSGTCGTI
jgi:hypothetical protein